MQIIEASPSIYYHFDDSTYNTKKTLSILEFSDTNQKRFCELQLEGLANWQPEKRLSYPKTPPTPKISAQDFAEEFQSNFMIVLDDKSQPKDVSFREASVISEYLSISLDNLNVSVGPKVAGDPIRLSFPYFKSKLDSSEGKPNQSKISNEGVFPAFRVRQRTVFKNKQNITNKLKRNEITDGLPKTCQHISVPELPQYFPSKLTPKIRIKKNLINQKLKSMTDREIECKNMRLTRQKTVHANSKLKSISLMR